MLIAILSTEFANQTDAGPACWDMARAWEEHRLFARSRLAEWGVTDLVANLKYFAAATA